MPNVYPLKSMMIHLTTGDIEGDRIAEIITGIGPAPQNPSWVKVFRAEGIELISFLSYSDNVKYGVKISVGNIGR